MAGVAKATIVVSTRGARSFAFVLQLNGLRRSVEIAASPKRMSRPVERADVA